MQDPCTCTGDLRDPDGPCGCGRGFSGMNSHRAISTTLVVEIALAHAEVHKALKSHLEAGGWLDPARCTPDEADVIVEELLRDMLQVANHFPVGTVVSRRLSQYFADDGVV